MTKRLIIDGQIFQTPAWHRGMGKYSLALLGHISQHVADAEWSFVDLLLSTELPLPADLLTALQKIRHVNLVKLKLLPNELDNAAVIKNNQMIIDNHIASIAKNQDIDFLILSLMQREIYPVFPVARPVNKLLLFYDLIPLMFFNTYLSDPVAGMEYLDKFTELFKTDKYLAISKTAANDLAIHLGIDKSRITSIDGGPIAHSATSRKIDVPEPFILMPTGNDYRKNNMRGVQGFSEFNKEHGNRYSLVVTSFFDKDEEAKLSAMSDNVIFTGNVSGEQLNYLYAQAEGLLFPPLYEGLGLPILEAVEKNKPVACSNISVFREISEEAFHYFDPQSIASIAQALLDMVKNPKINKTQYDKIIKNYTWQNSAKKFFKAASDKPGTYEERRKIACFGPDPSIAVSPAGNDILLGYAELGKRCDIDYYLENKDIQTIERINFLPHVAKTTKLGWGMSFDDSKYAAAIYSIGNGPDFASTFFTALAIPGITILYDLNLSGTWTEMANQKLVSQSRLSLEKLLEKHYGGKGAQFITSLISRQKAIVVFSEKDKVTVENILRKIDSKVQVYAISFPSSEPVYKELLAENESKPAANHYSYKQFAGFLTQIVEKTNG